MTAEESENKSAILRLVPSVEWLRHYPKEWLRLDVVAGLTAAAVVLPKAMAYATIAGLPVQVGLYTALVPMVIYALLGTSRPLSVSTTTTLAILAAAALGELGPQAGPAELMVAAATLTALVGAVLVVASLLKLGFVANFISEPVLTGFKSGIALVIIVDQIPKLIGVHIPKTGFVRSLVALVREIPSTSVPTLVVAVLLFALILGLEHFVPHSPAPLVAVAAGIGASALFGLQRAGVATVGAIPRGLPPLVVPSLDLVEALWPAAVGIALMSFTESIAAARAFGRPDEPHPVPNQELLALGLGNLAGGFVGAMAAGGGTTQTAVNRKAGARTQVAELVTAAAALATLLFLAPVIALMPLAVLATVVVAYSLDLFRPAEFRAIRRVRAAEFRWALIACAGVVLLGTLRGILVAVIVSMVSLAHQAYNPPVYTLGRRRGTQEFRPLSDEHPGDETWPGLLILKTTGRIFFANAQGIGDKMWTAVREGKPSVFVFDLGGVFDIEYTALKMLGEADAKLRGSGITLWLAALNPEVAAVVERSPLGEALGRDRILSSVQAAVEKYQKERTGAGAAAPA